MIILKRKKNKKKRDTSEEPKERNWIAQKAFTRSGAGPHKDKKKEQSKKACRGRTNEN